MSDSVLAHRSAELAAAGRAFESLAAGHAGGLFVRGARGIGRTALLHAMLDKAPADAVLLRAVGTAAESDVALGVFGQLFAGGEFPAVADAIDSAGDASLDRRGRDAVVAAVRVATAGAPLVIAVDDADRADGASLRLLTQLGRRVTGSLLIVLTATDSCAAAGNDGLLAEFAAVPGVFTLRPEPLCHGCTTAAIERVFSGPVDPELATVGYLVSEGNPLVVMEFAHRLRAAGVHGGSPDQQELMRVAGGTIDATRMDWLRADHPQATTLLAAMAVLGAHADPATTAMVVGVGELAAESAWQHLADAGFVDVGPVTFRNDLLRQAVLASIPLDERRHLHLTAAELLSKLGAPSPEVAEHLMVIEPTGRAWAVTALQSAARAAAASGDYDAASRYLRRAIAESDELPEPGAAGSLTEQIGAVELHHDLQSSMRHAERIAESEPDPLARATALLPLVSPVLAVDSTPATATFTELARELDHRGAASEKARLPAGWERLGAVALLVDPGADAGRWRRRLAGLRADRRGGTVAVALGAALAGVLAARGRGRADAVQLARTAVGHSAEDIAVLPALLTLLWADHLDEVLAAADAGVLSARDRSAPVEEAAIRVVRAETLRRAGRLADALADAQAAWDLALHAHARGIGNAAGAVLVLGLLDSGQTELAREAMARVDPVARPHPLVTAYVRYAAGQEAMSRGAAARAMQYFLQAGHTATAAGIANPACLPWQAAVVAAQLASQDFQAAARSADLLMDAARRWGADGTLAPALAAWATTGADDRIAAMEQAARAAAASGQRLDLRPVVAAAAAAATADGDRALSAQITRTGPQLIAAAAARSADATADAADGAPDGVRLTASETRVTDLVMQGMSNQEVADALCLSRRTVDTHLNRIYRKLHISSRSALPAALRKLG